MVFGTVLGAAVGATAGLFAYQSLPFGAAKAGDAKTYDYIDQKADSKNEFREEWNVDAKDSEVTRVLQRSPYWCTFPDYERFLWFNNFVSIIWERNAAATKKTLEDVITTGLADWQKLTVEATKGWVTLDDLRIEEFDFGDVPLRCAGLKMYDTSQDEVILDMPVQWGSKVNIRVSARVGVKGKVQLYLPISIKNIQLSGCARITLRPLVDEIPVIGAVNITLMDKPIVDLELYIDESTDLIRMPLMHILLQMIIQEALGKLMVYPNSMTFDIMDNAGLPPPMAGMLVVRVVGCTKLPSSRFDKIDPYVEVEVRKGRALVTEYVDNNDSPLFDEEKHNSLMRFVVDDINKQKIRVVVKDSGFLMDTTVGYCEIPFKNAPFVVKPREVFSYDVGLQLVTKQDRKKGFDMEMVDGDVDDVGTTTMAQDALEKAATTEKMGSPDKGQPSISPASSTSHGGLRERMGLKKKKRKEELVMSQDEMEHTVTMQGSGKQGSVQLELQFYPFNTAVAEAETSAAGRKRGQLETIADVKDTDRAVITATLMACHNLEESSDPWVQITLYDKLQGRSEIVKSTVKMNESNPRWDMKFDFVDVSAASRVTIVVFDKACSGLLPGVVSSAVGLAMSIIKKPEQRKLGWLELPLAEVAKNGMVKDRFNLRDATKGEIELKFEWHTIKRQAEDMATMVKEMEASKAKEAELYNQAHQV